MNRGGPRASSQPRMALLCSFLFPLNSYIFTFYKLVLLAPYYLLPVLFEDL